MHIVDSVFQPKVRFYKLYEWWRASSVLTENQKSVLTENCPKTKKCELFTWGLWSGRNPEGVFLLPKSNMKWSDISHHLHMSFLLLVFQLIHQLMSNIHNVECPHIYNFGPFFLEHGQQPKSAQRHLKMRPNQKVEENKPALVRIQFYIEILVGGE